MGGEVNVLGGREAVVVLRAGEMELKPTRSLIFVPW